MQNQQSRTKVNKKINRSEKTTGSAKQTELNLYLEINSEEVKMLESRLSLAKEILGRYQALSAKVLRQNTISSTKE